MELNTVPGKRCCPWVNEWQFTTVVVVAAVEPCDLCYRVQMQGNGGNKWILGDRLPLRSPPQHSQLNPTGHWTLLCDRRSLLLKHAICNFTCRCLYTGNACSDIQPHNHCHTDIHLALPNCDYNKKHEYCLGSNVKPNADTPTFFLRILVPQNKSYVEKLIDANFYI